MQIIQGNAVGTTAPGSAGKTEKPAARLEKIANSAQASGTADRAADKARPRSPSQALVQQVSNEERPRANAPRGSLLDIRV